jgi:nitrogenase molybdenum-iron protein NifN
VRRQRSQLVDAMLDGHFHFGKVKVALAAEPDLLWSAGMMLSEMGAELAVAVTTARSPLLERLPLAEVIVGDLEDFENSAAAAGCDLLMTHSHGRQAAERLSKPLFRIGMPIFDRIGNAHICHAGYRGTRNFVYEVGNLLIDHQPHHGPQSWPLPAASRTAAFLGGAELPGEVQLAAPAGLPAEAHLPAQIGPLNKLAPASA